MSKTLSTGQDALARRAHLVPINLVKLTDYAASTTWYLSDRAVSYDYEGTGAVDFLPWVRRFGSIRESMSHIPSPAPVVPEWELALSNETWEGERIAETLDAEDLEGAAIEWAQILVDGSPSSYPVDLSDWASTDKTIFFAGKVRRVGPITEESLRLSCSAELPLLEWAYVNSDGASPEDIGSRIAFPYGTVSLVRATKWHANTRTTIGGVATAGGIEVDAEDSSSFPPSGLIQLEDELIWYNHINDPGGEFDSCERGVYSTTPAAHADDTLIKDATLGETYIIADNAPSAVNAIYAQYSGAPAGYLRPLTASTHYTLTLADTASIPGKTVASITISPAQGAYLTHSQWGKPSALYADVDGPVAPTIYDYTIRDECESATGWTRGSLDASIYRYGSGSIRFQSGIDPGLGSGTALSESQDAADWTLSSGSGWIISDWLSNYTTAPNSVRMTRGSSGASNNGTIQCDLTTPIDLTSLALRFNVAFVVGRLAPNSYIEVSVKRIADGDTLTWQLTYADLRHFVDLGVVAGDEEQWTTVVCRVDEASTDTMGADYTGIDRLEVTGYTSGNYYYMLPMFDDFETVSADAGVETAFKTFSPEDWSGEEALNIQAYVTRAEPDEIKFWVSSDTPAGSTPPANREEITLPSLPLNEWKMREDATTTVNSPNLAAIISLGWTVTYKGYQGTSDVRYFVYPLNTDDPYIYLDRVRSGDAQASTYKAGAGNLIEHPADVFRHFVEVVGGGTVDETSVVAAQTNLGSDVFAVNAVALGLTWADVAARIGYECRANIVRLHKTTGPVWGLLTASTTYTFSAPTLAVADWEPGGFALVGRSVDQDLYTRFTFYYLFDDSIGYTSEAYTGFLRCSPSDNDLSSKVATADIVTAEATFGAHEAQPSDFLAIQDEDTAIDVAGYYVHETIRRAKMFAIRGVPWYDGEAYALELGDMRNVTPPWSSTAVKCRVIEITKDQTEQIELRLVEVQ